MTIPYEKEFEEYFLSHETYKGDLDKVCRGEDEVYFYTTTKMLHKAFVEKFEQSPILSVSKVEYESAQEFQRTHLSSSPTHWTDPCGSTDIVYRLEPNHIFTKVSVLCKFCGAVCDVTDYDSV